MERMRQLRAAIGPHDSAARFRGLGVDVFLDQGVFSGPVAQPPEIIQNALCLRVRSNQSIPTP